MTANAKDLPENLEKRELLELQATPIGSMAAEELTDTLDVEDPSNNYYNGAFGTPMAHRRVFEGGVGVADGIAQIVAQQNANAKEGTERMFKEIWQQQLQMQFRNNFTLVNQQYRDYSFMRDIQEIDKSMQKGVSAADMSTINANRAGFNGQIGSIKNEAEFKLQFGTMEPVSSVKEFAEKHGHMVARNEDGSIKSSAQVAAEAEAAGYCSIQMGKEDIMGFVMASNAQKSDAAATQAAPSSANMTLFAQAADPAKAPAATAAPAAAATSPQDTTKVAAAKPAASAPEAVIG